MSEVEVRKTR